MHAKRFLAGSAAALSVLTVAVGCAAQQIEPKLALRAAATHLAEAPRAGFTVKLTGSADDLLAALPKEEKADAATLRTLFDTSVTLAYDQAGAGADDDRMLLAATVGGVAGTEIRLVDQTVYLKAPVAELAKKFEVDDFSEVRDAAVAELPEAGAFFDGKWVSVDAKEAGKTALPTEDADAEKALAELKASATALFEGADVVRDQADDKHLIVTSSTTKAYAEMKRLVTAVGGEMGSELTKEMGAAPKDRPIVLDLWIDDDKLTALEVNVLQFVDGATGRAAIRLEVTTGTEITAPQDATKIDPSKVLGFTAGGPDGPGDDPLGAGGAESQATELGYYALVLAETEGGQPSKYLKKVITETGYNAKVIRRGVAQVTADGKTACLVLPKSADADPKVTAGRC
jgi:hypothetical protein